MRGHHEPMAFAKERGAGGGTMRGHQLEVACVQARQMASALVTTWAVDVVADSGTLARKWRVCDRIGCGRCAPPRRRAGRNGRCEGLMARVGEGCYVCAVCSPVSAVPVDMLESGLDDAAP